MKAAIFYKSFLGATKQYSKWLAEEAKIDIYTFDQANDKLLQSYDMLVVASGTYANWMPLTGFLKRYWPILKSKRVIVMSVGLSPADDPYTRQTFTGIPAEIRKSVQIVRIAGKLFGMKTPDGVKRGNLAPVLQLLK
jgi:menaquinone-dependent protoporphyrinogen IX oxidase